MGRPTPTALPTIKAPNQEWWIQMTLLIGPSLQVVIAVSDNTPLLPRDVAAGRVYVREWGADRWTRGAVGAGVMNRILEARR